MATRKTLAALSILFLGAVGTSAWTVLLDIDEDGDPWTINASTTDCAAEVYFVLWPTEPPEVIRDVYFGLGGSCLDCVYVSPGYVYGTTWVHVWESWATHPQFTTSAEECALCYGCFANPGYHCVLWATAPSSFLLTEPIFLGSTEASAVIVIPQCPQPPHDLMTFPYSGQEGNTIYFCGGVPIADDSWGRVKALYK